MTYVQLREGSHLLMSRFHRYSGSKLEGQWNEVSDMVQKTDHVHVVFFESRDVEQTVGNHLVGPGNVVDEYPASWVMKMAGCYPPPAELGLGCGEVQELITRRINQ